MWTRAALDLGAFAGQRVQIAFRFTSNTDDNVGSGWYVDDVVVTTGTAPGPFSLQGFENGLGDWHVDRGDWQVGPHSASLGPGRAHGGRWCAGTVTNDNYDPYIDTRLVSPWFEVQAAAESPRLRFWHWFSTSPEDLGTVEIRRTAGGWETLSPTLYNATSRVWTRRTLDLQGYAGETVQIGFRLRATGDGSVGAGWYIDDVEVATGPIDSNLINNPERWNSGLRDWDVDRGSWQVGIWRGAGETNVCAGTVLDGNYDASVDSRLISPEFEVPPAADSPRLRFRHAWSLAYPGDGGTVLIRPKGQAWENLSPNYVRNNQAWTRTWLDLTAFAGERVQIAFQLKANSDGNVGFGWYVDDVEVATGRTCFSRVNNPEGFESGWGDWNVDYGNWQVGRPSAGVGPGAAFKGIRCAGTVLAGPYDAYTDSRLISPPFVVPCGEAAPRLRYAHWYEFGSGDSGAVEIRELPNGGWIQLNDSLTGTSGGWSTGFLDLAPYAGKLVQLDFRFRANGDGSVGAGWYVDEVRVQADLAPLLPDREIVEGELLSFPVTSTCRNVKYLLDAEAGPPPGASLDPDFGLFTWQPEECQGPGTYEIKVVLVDPSHGACPLGVLTNRITVLERNEAPSSALPARLPSSPECRSSSMPPSTFSTPIVPRRGSPSRSNPARRRAPPSRRTGDSVGRPTLDQCCRTNSLRIRVTDDGQPPLSATTTVLAHARIRIARTRIAAGETRNDSSKAGAPACECELLASPVVSAAIHPVDGAEPGRLAGQRHALAPSGAGQPAPAVLSTSGVAPVSRSRFTHPDPVAPQET